MRNVLTLYLNSPDNSRINPEVSGERFPRHGVGYRADRRPLFLPTFARNERFAKHSFEGFPLSPSGIETLALSDLLHQYRIAQNIKRIFQPLILVVINQHSRRSSVARDDDLFFP